MDMQLKHIDNYATNRNKNRKYFKIKFMTTTQFVSIVIMPVALFIAGLFVKYFMILVKDVGEIKTTLKVNEQSLKNHEANLDYLERRVVSLEEKLN
jgi:hypothetical protein